MVEESQNQVFFLLKIIEAVSKYFDVAFSIYILFILDYITCMYDNSYNRI